MEEYIEPESSKKRRVNVQMVRNDLIEALYQVQKALCFADMCSGDSGVVNHLNRARKSIQLADRIMQKE